jgi:hypothetical protein
MNPEPTPSSASGSIQCYRLELPPPEPPKLSSRSQESSQITNILPDPYPEMVATLARMKADIEAMCAAELPPPVSHP